MYVVVSNNTDVTSASGTMYMSMKSSAYVPAFKSETVYIPSLKPGEAIGIYVYLKLGNMNDSAFMKYVNNDPSIGPLTFDFSVHYNVPDIAEEAKKQGVKGKDPNRPDRYVWDKGIDGYFTRKPFVMMDYLFSESFKEGWIWH